MSITKRIESIAALRLEVGKLIGTTGFQYGGSTIIELGTGHAIPYTPPIDVTGEVATVEDESIDGVAFKSMPVQSMLSATLNSLPIDFRFIGMDRLLYWMFGYEDGGSSPQSLGGGLYSHLFELDMHERHLTSYRSNEDTAVDYDATDRKNRFAVIGVKRGTNDYRYPFVLCNGFSFSSAAGAALKCTMKGLAYREDRGDYSSGSWTFAAGVAGSANLIMHHHCTFSLKAHGGAYVELGITSLEVNVDIPLQKAQDSESGLYPIEPVMNGQYGVSLTVTLTRHSVDTYLAYRDAFTECHGKVVFADGAGKEFGLYFPELKISASTVGGEDVANNPITFAIGYEPTSGNPFTTEIGDHDLIQNGPIFCLVKNTNSVNEMRRE